MFRKIGAIVLLVSLITASTASANPIIEALTGKLEPDTALVLFGKEFGTRGLMTPASGFITSEEAPPRSVILGEAPLYADCQSRYQLRTTVWSTERIELVFDIPGVMEGMDLFLFVLDDEGGASPGFALPESEPSENERPGTPGKPEMRPSLRNLAKETSGYGSGG